LVWLQTRFSDFEPEKYDFLLFFNPKKYFDTRKILGTPFLALVRPLWEIGRLWRFWFSQKLDFQILNPKNRFLPDFGPEKMFDPAKIFRTFVPVVP